MSNPIFGIAFERVDNEARPGVPSDMSIVGLVGTAPAADAGLFPLNTPVFMFSDDATKLAALGIGGTLGKALARIQDQLGEFQVAARCVIVRVNEGGDAAETITNIVGSSSSKTGLFALKEAGPVLGYIPRLIGVPGYTSQQESGLGTPVIVNGGSGGTAGTFNLAFTGGTGTGAAGTFTVTAGAITSVTITNPGVYTVAPTLSFAASSGLTGQNVTVALIKLANGVCAALPAILDNLLAHAVVSGPATTLQAYTDWRETISSFRLIPVETAVKVGSPAIVEDGAPAVLGIAVRRDHEKGGRPFHSWANQPVRGIVGPNRPINFSLTDGATEGQTILEQNGGIIIRGEMGVESAIASGGFVYVGTDNAGEDELWRFYNVTRGRDYIHLLFLKTLRFYLGRFNLTGQTIEAVRNTMEFALRDLKADEDILGYKVSFTRDQNSAENLRLGKFTIDFAAEEPAVLRFLGIRSSRYRPALDALLDQLLSQVDAVTG